MKASLNANWERLVGKHVGLVAAIARNLRATLPLCVEIDDLIGAGQIGLVQAARRFDSKRGASFVTFAKQRIRGEMLDYLRGLDPNARPTRKRMKILSEIYRRHQGRATDETLAAESGLSVVAVRKHRCGVVSISALEDSAIRGREPNFSREDLNAEEGQAFASALADRVLKELRPARLAEILFRYYVEGRTMKQIGVLLGVNESRISQLHSRALQGAREILGPSQAPAARRL